MASYFIKEHPLAGRFFPLVEGKRAALSLMTVAELYQWAELHHWGERRKEGLELLLKTRYVLLGFEHGLAKEWARVRAEGKASGRPIAVQDAWVAASARYYSLPLLTNNRSHFGAVAGVVLLG